MKLFNTLLAASAVVATSALFTVDAAQSDVELFNNFVAKYEKSYATDNVERARRFKIFSENLREAERQQKANPHATFGVTPFTDLTPAEFKVYHNADAHFQEEKIKHAKLPRHEPKIKNLKDAGKSINWVTRGAVTPVKNQGQCGSCWAFSTTGVIEGQWFLAGHSLVSLSEQFLVSCDGGPDSCQTGGLPSQAIQWIVQGPFHGEIATESSYPYTSGGGQVPTCQKSGWKVGAKIEGQRAVDSNEPAMWGALFGDGPISIGVDAQNGWQTYTGGIVTNCNGRQLDHGVLIVGIDLNHSPPYWTVKNSWTADWGEKGYIRLEYGTNQCGLDTVPVLAVVNKNSVPTPAPLPPTPAPTQAPPTPVPPPSPEAAGWNLQYPPSGIPLLQEAMGISMIDTRTVYVAGMVTGSGSGVGPQVGVYDGQEEGSISLLNSQGLPFLEMELAIAGYPGYPKGAVAGLMFPIIDKSPFAYIANTTTILPSACTGCGLESVVQGASVSPDGNYVLGADQGSTNGGMQALLSTDGGKTFNALPFGNVPIAQPNCTFPRYAAIASENVFYVTLGDWGSNNSGVSAHYENMRNIREGKKEWMTTATRKYVYDEKTKQTKYVSSGPLQTYKSFRKNKQNGEQGSSASSSGYCGNSAEILRTADAGKTWQSVFSSTEHFYFNEIACFDEMRCLAVGEGFNEDAGVRIYQTLDGVNWKRVFFQESTDSKSWSFFSVEIADRFNGEAWVGGSFELPDRQAGGVFFHTLDFGNTWAKFEHGIPSLVEITQISFAQNSFGQVGFATAMTAYQTTNIVRFDRTKVGPGPNEQSFFTQKTCLNNACNMLCQLIEFPEAMCIPDQSGGSVTALCQGSELLQTAFETTDCSGKGNTTKVPLNQCMKSQQGNYFEFTCNQTKSVGGSWNEHRPRRIFNSKKDKIMKL